MTSNTNNNATVTIGNMPLRGKSYWIVAVSSMEQIIGAGLSTLVGVMIPMIGLLHHAQLSPVMQGVLGAAGLIGIAVGSPVIGKLSDKHGYLAWFRLCPLLIIAGALIGWMAGSVAMLAVGLFVAGIGVGGGYSLDSAYIDELLPDKWQLVMVGAAKGACAIGFIGVALLCWWILDADPNPAIWNKLMLILAAMAALTFLMRIHWAESPKWLLAKGKVQEAQKAVETFYGKGVALSAEEIAKAKAPKQQEDVSWASMLKGDNLRKAILCGIPWACEGLGVYGFGVFLPVLVMALGIESSTAVGIHKIVNSVEVTALVNFFILPGFILGLLLMRKASHIRMLWLGFVISAAGLLLLYCGYALHWEHWVLILGFIIFELALNAGPHLVTFILPSQVYPISDRGTGSGLAAMTGKIGAVVGVVVMPLLLDAGGAKLVLIVSIAVMLLGAAVAIAFRSELNR